MCYKYPVRLWHPMDEYDVLVVGSGSGLNIAYRAVEKGLSVALVFGR